MESLLVWALLSGAGGIIFLLFGGKDNNMKIIGILGLIIGVVLLAFSMAGTATSNPIEEKKIVVGSGVSSGITLYGCEYSSSVENATGVTIEENLLNSAKVDVEIADTWVDNSGREISVTAKCKVQGDLDKMGEIELVATTQKFTTASSSTLYTLIDTTDDYSKVFRDSLNYPEYKQDITLSALNSSSTEELYLSFKETGVISVTIQADLNNASVSQLRDNDPKVLFLYDKADPSTKLFEISIEKD